MPRILFVDDQANVLSALRRMLHGFRQEWDMEFATSGQEALHLLGERNFDIVVTDMRMPLIDGAELLNRVRERWPSVARIVLSGQSEPERIFRAIGPTHIYLSKPCDAARITATVLQSCALRDRLPNDELKQMVSKIDAAPCQSALLKQLIAELDSPQAEIHSIGEIIAADIGMTAKILQLVSSSFFGQPQRVNSASQAVSLIGLDILRELVLSVGIFRPIPQETMGDFSLEKLTKHSLAVAHCARQIAELESNDPQVINDAWLAGMLHDVGKLILVGCFPEEYRKAVMLAKAKQVTLWQAEMETFGATHAEVGSYLLCLWGLPQPITEAVTYYRMPSQCPREDFRPLTAVHGANLLHREQVASLSCSVPLGYASECMSDPNFAASFHRWSDAIQFPSHLGAST